METHVDEYEPPHDRPRRPLTRAVIWLPGLAVAVGAAVATAHGLYEVAHAARVPTVIAWLYPLITDGLALVAYAATAQLRGAAARYAWSVVVLAAGLSGLAQASFLASDSAVEASAALRFGVGAWPAVAAAIVAHLLYLLASERAPAGPVIGHRGQPSDQEPAIAAVRPVARAAAAPAVQRVPHVVADATVQRMPPSIGDTVQRAPRAPSESATERRPRDPSHEPDRDEPDRGEPERRAEPATHGRPREPAGTARPGATPARDRAQAAATHHARRHGALPTVSELEAMAEVSRGTAATVLKHLRAEQGPTDARRAPGAG